MQVETHISLHLRVGRSWTPQLCSIRLRGNPWLSAFSIKVSPRHQVRKSWTTQLCDIQSMVLHILRQDTQLPVLGRDLVCQALPFIPSSSLVLPSVLAATAPTSQSDPLQPAPSRKAQQVVAKGQHCGLLSLEVFPIRAGLCSGNGIAVVVGVTAGESVGRNWLVSNV